MSADPFGPGFTAPGRGIDLRQIVWSVQVSISAAKQMQHNSSRINTYTNRNCNSFRMRTYKNEVLQVLCNEHLQKKWGGGSRLLLRKQLKPAIQEAAQNRGDWENTLRPLRTRV